MKEEVAQHDEGQRGAARPQQHQAEEHPRIEDHAAHREHLEDGREGVLDGAPRDAARDALLLEGEEGEAAALSGDPVGVQLPQECEEVDLPVCSKL